MYPLLTPLLSLSLLFVNICWSLLLLQSRSLSLLLVLTLSPYHYSFFSSFLCCISSPLSLPVWVRGCGFCSPLLLKLSVLTSSHRSTRLLLPLHLPFSPPPIHQMAWSCTLSLSAICPSGQRVSRSSPAVAELCSACILHEFCRVCLGEVGDVMADS